MRRLLRIPLDALTILSLLLFLTAAVLWVRSYFVAEAVVWYGVRLDPSSGQDARWSVNVWSARGGVGVYWDQLWKPAGGWGPAATTVTWSRDRMRVYPYVPIPQLRQGRHVAALGVTFFEQRSGVERVTDPTLWLGPLWHAKRERVVIMPYWLLMMATAPLPGWRGLRYRRRRRGVNRTGRGLCPACGYDLRATPARCPECGATPPDSRAAEPSH